MREETFEFLRVFMYIIITAFGGGVFWWLGLVIGGDAAVLGTTLGVLFIGIALIYFIIAYGAYEEDMKKYIKKKKVKQIRKMRMPKRSRIKPLHALLQ